MNCIADDERMFLNLGFTIMSFDREWLREHPTEKRFVEHWRDEQIQNPVRFFLPHCIGSPTPGDSVSAKFINDDQHSFVGFTAPNRFGKTTAAWIKMLLTYGLIPTDENWEVFTKHGIKYHPFTEPREVAVVSYNWDNHRSTLWPKVIKVWTPLAELGKWYEWSVPQQCHGVTVELKCGSTIKLMACAQPQGAFESDAQDLFLWDEQGVEPKFMGAEARLKTRRRVARGKDGYEHIRRGVHTTAMTPHKVDDRPDTGAGTWLHRICKGEESRGLNTTFYHDGLLSVPDWIFSERQKKDDLSALAEAEHNNNKKLVRELRSRIFGEWEETGGLVYDEFDDEVHVVEVEPQPDWCAIRCIDHGRTNPTSCLTLFITPAGQLVVGDEYLEAGKTIYENVHGIIAHCGNVLEPMESLVGPHQTLSRYKEVDSRLRVLYDVMDGRSFRKPSDDKKTTIGDMYRMAGLSRVRGAPIEEIQPGISLVKEMLRIRPDLMHIVTGKPGAPRLYVMRKCRRLISSIKSYRNKEAINAQGNPSEKPQEKNDHDMDALRYGIISRPIYRATRTIGRRINDSRPDNKRKYWCDEDKKRPSDSKVRVRHKRRDQFTR